MPVILAIESSCDDTSAAICKDGKILANITTSQAIHIEWGGVVPELASREHLKNIVYVVDAAIKHAKIHKKDIDGIAFTQGPGLIGALMVGVSFAKSMALVLDIPLLSVNHMQAHVMANFIDAEPAFPHLCLTVSGGHTQIVLVESPNKMQVIGETIDDAAGEAFDKTAKILGLPYPGGPLVDKHAQQGNPLRFKFPEGKVEGLNFSFSGLKTAVLYFVRDHLVEEPDFVQNNMDDICASIQHTIIAVLMKKITKAAEMHGITTITLAGGVSANSGLRSALQKLGETKGWNVHIPAFQYCTDNAGMIGIAGYYKFLDKDFCDQTVEPIARLGI